MSALETVQYLWHQNHAWAKWIVSSQRSESLPASSYYSSMYFVPSGRGSTSYPLYLFVNFIFLPYHQIPVLLTIYTRLFSIFPCLSSFKYVPCVLNFPCPPSSLCALDISNVPFWFYVWVSFFFPFSHPFSRVRFMVFTSWFGRTFMLTLISSSSVLRWYIQYHKVSK